MLFYVVKHVIVHVVDSFPQFHLEFVYTELIVWNLIVWNLFTLHYFQYFDLH
jgi:hypothetical protein